MIRRYIRLVVRASSIDPDAVGRSVGSEWLWDPSDPFAVTFRAEDATWHFGRDLVLDGLPSGIGDVRLRQVDDDTVALTLHSPDGTAELCIPDVDFRLFAEYVRHALPQARTPSDDDFAQLLRGVR